MNTEQVEVQMQGRAEAASCVDSAARPMHKDDAVAWFQSCSEKFGQLAMLFKALRTADKVDTRKLIELGFDVSCDWENMADCWRDELQTGGFRQ